MGGRGSSSGGGGGTVSLEEITDHGLFDKKLDPVKMTDNQFADLITDSLDADIPLFLDDTPLQKVMYVAGLNEKPQVMTDAQFNQYVRQHRAETLYRTVDGVYLKQYDMGINAKDICEQVMYGSLTRTGRGSLMGDGFYFANDLDDSKRYGTYTGNVKQTAYMKAVLKPGAKGISSSRIYSMARDEISNNTKLGRALEKAVKGRFHSGVMALLAVHKGYDYIEYSSYGYFNVLNRGCLIMSDQISPK